MPHEQGSSAQGDPNSIEPKLIMLTGKELDSRTTNTRNEARLDIRARGLSERGQHAFLDLRVFHPNVCRYFNNSL